MKYKAQWIAAFENHLRPWKAKGDGALWRTPIANVSELDVLEFLKRLQQRLPHTSRKVRQRLDATFEHGKLHGWCNGRPTQIVRALRKTAPKMYDKPHRALPFKDAPALYAQLAALDSTASRCLRLTVLTAARTAESTRAEWAQIELRVWTVPADKMKAGEKHRVYLSDEALNILQKQKGLHERWVFPSPSGNYKSLSNMAMLNALERIGMAGKTTVHGFARGTFSTSANETGAARPDVIEACLAHGEANLVRAA